ncbi:MAG: hypothetical protein Q9169_008244 [Polycauliona sp. 2 TL-2023]
MHPTSLLGYLSVVFTSSSVVSQTAAGIINLPHETGLGAAISEWTGMGDSYAAGVGAGNMIAFFDATCLRHDESYPVLSNTNLQPRPRKFNFVACSGDKFPAILQKQLQPALLRPRWGDRPEFVTISMGGNDIGFLELVIRCIYSIPNPTNPRQTCDDAIAGSQRLVNSPDFVNDAINVIIATLRQGISRGTPNFKVFVTGYAQFFNEQTTQCNDVTFLPSWLKKIGEQPQYLTLSRRRTLNKIARDLNAALGQAVMRARLGAAANRVFFINYDREFENHRFCDREEPNPNDADTWFFTYGADQDRIGEFLEGIPAIRDLLWGKTNRTMSFETVYRLVLSAEKEGWGEKEKKDVLVDLTRVFHPKVQGHRAIERRVRDVVLRSRAVGRRLVNGTGVS